MDFQQLLAKMAQLDQPVAEAAEVVAECPQDLSNVGTPIAAPVEPSPSMSVNLNAQGLNNIADLIKLIAKAEEGEIETPEMPALAIDAPGMTLSGDEEGPEALPNMDLDNTDGEEGPELDDQDSEEEPKDEWANSPDPELDTVDTMVNKLAGGPNEPKQMFKHSYKQGDNPMAMKEGDLRAQIKAELAQRLAEAKGAK